MNNVNLIGRVGGEIELRYTASGKAVASFALAVDDGWGESKKTAWVGITLWGPTAECARRNVRKGDRLGITGRLSQEEWDDKEGKKQRKTKVTCESMHLLTDNRTDAPGQPYEQRRRSSPGMPPAPMATNHDEEKLPF